jgi:transcriptional antiterminator RfaH
VNANGVIVMDERGATACPEPAGDGAARWYVVHSQPHREHYAAKHLEAQGYAVFMPRLARTVRHARRTKSVLRPLFPRYLFLRLDLDVDRWRSVRSTFGVASMIMDGERPRPAPCGVVEALVAAYDGQGGYDFQSDLRVGDRVRFLSGAFADRLGQLVALDDAGRVHVLLDILGAKRLVSARADNLIPAAL